MPLWNKLIRTVTAAAVLMNISDQNDVLASTAQTF